MNLLTAHRILIGSGIAVFLLYAVHEAFAYAGGDSAALLRALLSVAGAGGLLAYFRWLRGRTLRQS